MFTKKEFNVYLIRKKLKLTASQLLICLCLDIYASLKTIAVWSYGTILLNTNKVPQPQATMPYTLVGRNIRMFNTKKSKGFS